MVNLPNTPEALLGRSDSKNRSTTCKGITSSGRPCRRALAATATNASPGRSPLASALSGVVKVVEGDGRVQEADYYCWQHKDQAQEKLGLGREKRSVKLFPLQERSSIDTLVERLGINGRKNSVKNEKKGRRNNGGVKPPRRTSAVDFADPNQRPGRPSVGEEKSGQRAERTQRKKKPSFWASLCCATNDDEDYVEIVRHKKRTSQQQQNSGATTSDRPPRIPHESRPQCSPVPPRKSVPGRQQRTSSNPQTSTLLSLIPQHCSPQTTSSLLAELIKPISPADEEGYIYIFWLTPQTKEAPAASTARSLLSPPEIRPGSGRISDVMTEYSYDGDEQQTTRGVDGVRRGKNTIMLKIGRANNVTRRMNEWQRQCGYQLNLVRWYPYVPSSGSPSPQPSPSRPSASRRQSDVVRKVPFVKRVERLIHLELAEKRVLRDCEACGKEHREWFEVEASQEGVRGVDECVRRWVGWAERQQGGA